MPASPDIPIDSNSITIAKYDFNPNLQIGEQVDLVGVDIVGWEGNPFTATAVVTKQKKQICPKLREGTDVFRLCYILRMVKNDEARVIADLKKRIDPKYFQSS
ncbi:MAG: hypothetical protein DCF22_10295 [Leptolyngbya sp.]|nr:MAG: hypothetical protein DCF22_10295 [Leptolyngbya sp.]